MKDWPAFWNSAPKGFEETDFLRQVGKTVGGIPIASEQVDLIVDQLLAELNLQPTDAILDMCCGNGLITGRMAPFCREIVGVDFSEPLIQLAHKYHCAANIRYICASVLKLAPKSLRATGFHKVIMYEALQHFEEDELSPLLRIIRACLRSGGLAYLGSIPDTDRLWSFYNTPERREEYFRRRAEGTEVMGTWWRRQTLRETAEAEGFVCRFVEQHPGLHTARYRFDVVLQCEGCSAE